MPPAAGTVSESLLRVERLTEASSLETLTPGWNALAADVPQALPQLSAAWVRSFVETLGADLPFAVHAAFAGLALVGVLALVRRPHPRLGARAPLCGPPRDHHTRSGDALLHPVFAPLALRALLASVRAREEPCFGLELRGVRDSSPTLAALDEARPFGIVVRTDDERGSYVKVDGDLAGFRAGLSDNFRRNLRKAGNRVAKAPGTRFRRDVGPAADPATLDVFLEVEASGWKGRGGTAIAQDPTLVRFYRALVARLHAAGWLEWHRIELEGRTAAIHLGARLGRSLVLLKIAYDEAFARVGPGNLLFDHVVEAEFAERRVDEINCMTDMPWHRNWEMPRSAYTDVVIHPRRALPLVAGVCPARAKAWLRGIPLVRDLAARRAAAHADGAVE